MSTDVQPRGAELRATVQRFGGYLSGMVMPNIGAFIAWGLITALFIPAGWLPNEQLATLVDPMVQILLPVLIGYTGGRLVHEQRGAVAGAIATIGIVVGAEVPMFLGAMIIGPLAGYVIKLFDRWVMPRVRSGFEMLVENFSVGILGGLMAILGMLAIGPVVQSLTNVLGAGVQWLVDTSLLPLASVLIEPAKVLFLNNAINHGVLGPLGVANAAENGRAIEFLLEPNPGPGFGILAACLLFGPRVMRASVPGAMVIQFLGGIHEIYFPYVLARPKLILAAIAGGASGVAVFMVTGAGLTATPAPGSIFAVLAMTPRGGYLGVLAGIVVSAVVSFLVAGLLMGFGRGEKDDGADGADDGDRADPEDAERTPEDTDAPASESRPGGTEASPARDAEPGGGPDPDRDRAGAARDRADGTASGGAPTTPVETEAGT
ncbi:PTS mannitol transporter subunit IICB [Allonocardiopsis opalescens]|uniref:PTS system mannitol-specific IIC component n=1 Tax=Allonocardiopsis opalescens TaxID=1144618 RepID=A0A2T0QEA9_9ACTN|nr:PTS system mannitol-specific IIC component [Allonocardiopsis opalescens]